MGGFFNAKNIDRQQVIKKTYHEPDICRLRKQNNEKIKEIMMLLFDTEKYSSIRAEIGFLFYFIKSRI